MEHISIFNYEAYYLDFLEGNLNEADSALLLKFLEANPDLKLDDESLPLYNEEELISLDSVYKENLKQPEIFDNITMKNVEFFMISSTEGLLSEQKEAELMCFIGKDAQLAIEFKRYQSVNFNVDSSIVYLEKDKLKRKKKVVLWPYVAAAASVLAAVLIWTSINNEKVDESMPSPVIAEQGEKKIELKPNLVNEIDVIQIQDVPPSIVHNASMQVVDIKENFEPMLEDPIFDEVKPNINELERKPVNQVLISMDDNNAPSVSKQAWTESSTDAIAENDYAALHFGEMNNPIEPVTKFISNKTDKALEFRSAKKTANKPGGFYLKVGKFELSRKKH